MVYAITGDMSLSARGARPSLRRYRLKTDRWAECAADVKSIGSSVYAQVVRVVLVFQRVSLVSLRVIWQGESLLFPHVIHRILAAAQTSSSERRLPWL